MSTPTETNDRHPAGTDPDGAQAAGNEEKPAVPAEGAAEPDGAPADVSSKDPHPVRSEEAAETTEIRDEDPHQGPGEGAVHTMTSDATMAAPPWQRGGAVPASPGEPARPLHPAKPAHTVGGNVPGGSVAGGSVAGGSVAGAPMPGGSGPRTDQRHPIEVTHGLSPGFIPAATAPPNRYGHPVPQPFTGPPSQSMGRQSMGQDFSQPTVRIGGQPPPAQVPSQPSANSRVRPARIPRRASLQLRHLEPWSVLKVSLVLSVAGFLAWMVAVGVIYGVLEGMGVWDQLNGTYSDLTSVGDHQTSQDLISAGGVFGVAALVGLVNIVLITAMCTVGAFIYNASADLAGGIEVTLSERD